MGNVKNHFIMFQSANGEKFEHNLHAARKVAKDFKGDIMFVSVTTDEEAHKKVVEFFGIADDEIPTFRMTASVEDMVKYKPDNAALSEENIRAFIKSFKHRRQSLISKESRLNSVEELHAKKKKEVPSVQRLMMKLPLHPSMPNRLKNCWQDLKNLMKSLSLKEAAGPRLKRAAPC